jgi:predicted O-methyltransferase YrrM
LAAEVPFVTVEMDPERAKAVCGHIDFSPRVRCLQGDWKVLLDRKPFSFLFVDAAPAKRTEAEFVVQALAPGGMVLLDDLTPEVRWTLERRGTPDPVREFWLHHPLLRATDIAVSKTMAVILATRR